MTTKALRGKRCSRTRHLKPLKRFRMSWGLLISLLQPKDPASRASKMTCQPEERARRHKIGGDVASPQSCGTVFVSRVSWKRHASM
jgi:hypothetical protein